MKPKQWYQCGRKKGYETQRAANKAIERTMLRRDARDVATLNSYQCPHCHCWHFGHRKAKGDKTASPC